jgi:hypothetical protein
MIHLVRPEYESNNVQKTQFISSRTEEGNRSKQKERGEK